jgi:hypothetical protein
MNHHHDEAMGVQLALFEVDHPAQNTSALRSSWRDEQPDVSTECVGQLELFDPHMFVKPSRAA